MDDHGALPAFSAIIVAGGSGSRAGGGKPKQFARYRGKPLLAHSLDAFCAMGAQEIIVVHPAGAEATVETMTSGCTAPVTLVAGGPTRQQSVRNGLRARGGAADRVLIHDAARPGVTHRVVARLLAALDRHDGAIPVLPVVDSLAQGSDGLMTCTADRDALWRVQTPQAFRSSAIDAAHRAWNREPDAGDDAQVVLANGGTIAFVEGDEALKKITFAADFPDQAPAVRVGTGFDVHRLAAGEELWLGGIRIDSPVGLAGHSDADVVLHALVDALLGAIGEGDIGTHFPPSDPQWKGASSDKFLRHAVRLVAEQGYVIGNIDLTVICETPRIGPHRTAMQNRIAELVEAHSSLVSIKATTTEGLGFTGRAEGIAAQAVATLLKQT
ncbi:bifunctional 2-C-methyl-D-erythritol 4-phosphate cytidylyltransferase/2-C-methyl-D-erythritol 2,4-cyclodiphosphate synthase [Porphyrobacter sp. GA68]|uniref:bifunctional 2-C-methyl-D-erythritol 4-phosphate cytidylyltransferase/2-C-methyl-D-erythritol 2,4-cyclodiphosphate synthase n=1 Tax=Porphyrobacter sp. GA68 TaxID=2883480 RepID=UPI001D194E55|nr:bifunctional 2-C-methyl-D-erythritol 4-phosphate cytidylyltransferase/2-C-methyl-D-erythritol 2,4-cyclodiphosphate synthase [Porphyrobacter sp. GA68]